MKQKKKPNEEELNFWQPASDMFSALMLILMLIILLLCLYLVHIPEHSQIDPWAGDDEGGNWAGDGMPTPSMLILTTDDAGGGGGEEDGQTSPVPTFEVSPTPSMTPTPSPTPSPDQPGSGGGHGGGTGGGGGQGEGPGEEPDMGLKSAVYVMLVDAETDRTIKVPNVEFELYGDKHALQVLNTYYPERFSYRFYETTDAGTFYFPEKLMLGGYELHELTEAEGYDNSENIEFILDNTYDWDDPYVVRVPVMPSKNTIRVQMVDVENGSRIPGGSFDVVAAENIITADGTLRCRAGQIVDEIVCDETGYGESGELYLGQYTLREREIPQYYAGLLEEPLVQVIRKSDVLPMPETVASQRMRIRFSLSDELYPETGIAGAAFEILTGRGEPLQITTNSNGKFVLDTVEKGTTYHIRQTATVGNYRITLPEQLVPVDALGYMNGEAETTVESTNRLLRVLIGITDEFSNIQIPGLNLALYDSNNELVYTWTSSGNAMSIESLEPGTYYLIKGGEKETRYEIRVNDTAEIQTINLRDSYLLHYIIYAGVFLLALVALTALIVAMVRRKKKKKRSAAGNGSAEK